MKREVSAERSSSNEKCSTTHDGPQYALQLRQQIEIAALICMLAQEQRKFLEVALISQGLATSLRLGDLAVEMWRRRPVEKATNHSHWDVRALREGKFDNLKLTSLPCRLPARSQKLERGKPRFGRHTAGFVPGHGGHGRLEDALAIKRLRLRETIHPSRDQCSRPASSKRIRRMSTRI